MYSTSIEIWEILVAPFYLLVAVVMTFTIPSPKDRTIFGIGISAKIAGALAYTAIYLFYYGGGDTTAYFQTAVPLLNLIQDDFFNGIRIFFEPYSYENYSYFTQESGYPPRYILIDNSTFTVARIIAPVLLLSLKSYLLTSILIASIAFIGSWKLFQLFRQMATDGERIAIYSALLFPSALFWGSGISKDTITFTSLCYLTYALHQLLILRRYRLVTIFFAIFTLYLILSIKPYIFVVLLPASMLWIFNSSVQRIPNRILRLSMIPLTILVTVIIFAAGFSFFSPLLGDYGVENIIEKAIITQEDLKRDYYGGNSFDIGTIDPSIIGVLSKFPIATFYGFFGPTLIHVNNAVILFSALENTILLALTIAIFVLRNPANSLQKIASNPFLTYCIVLSVLLGFSIGLTTPNFGALVRFKIPMLPFFSYLLLALYYRKEIQLR